MPIYQPPRSDGGKLSQLKKAHATAVADIAAGRPSITTATRDAIAAFILIFEPLYNALTAALGGRMREVREREDARELLDTYVRDFWEVLKRRAHRMGQPAEVLVYYGLHSSGDIPPMSNFAALIDAAEKIVHGEADAVAAGYPAMANPSAGEVSAVLDDAKIQAADVPVADGVYDTAQAAIQAERPHGEMLAEDVHTDLLSSLRRLDRPSQRRIMRNYGCVFVPLPGEPVDPEDAAAAAAAAAEAAGSAEGSAPTNGSAPADGAGPA